MVARQGIMSATLSKPRALDKSLKNADRPGSA